MSEELRHRIAEAFVDVAYPDNDQLCNGWQQDDEVREIRHNFRRKHWRDFASPNPASPAPHSVAGQLHQGMCFLSASAWHFFLPAYLMSVVDNPKSGVFFLKSPLSCNQREKREQCYNCLTPKQSKVVVEVLEFVAEWLAGQQEMSLAHRDLYAADLLEITRALHYWRVWRKRHSAKTSADPDL